MPASIRSTFSFPITVPNPYSPGQLWPMIPTVVVNVDLHGSPSMEKYAEACLEQKMRLAQNASGHFAEEKMARKIENDSAIFARRVLCVGNEDYSNLSLWDITRVSRSRNKMISVTGSIVEPSLNFSIIFEDLIKITNTVSLIRK
jgi:hypothetical protein